MDVGGPEGPEQFTREVLVWISTIWRTVLLALMGYQQAFRKRNFASPDFGRDSPFTASTKLGHGIGWQTSFRCVRTPPESLPFTIDHFCG